MDKDRFIERLADVNRSVVRLTEAVEQAESPLVRDAVIQRFEFTFEVVWKALKLYLEHQGHECGGPRQTLKKAFDEKVIEGLEQSDAWLEMLNDRNMTSHAYDEGTALSVYANIVHKYARLLREMADKLNALKWD